MKLSPGCNCCGVAGTVFVQGCKSEGVDGAAVVIKSGATVVASGTTSGGGLFPISLVAGTYTFEVTGPTGAGFAFNTGSVAYSGGTVVRLLVADASHVCTPRCNYPVPKTLTTSDGLGTHSLVYAGISFGAHLWMASATATADSYEYDGTPGNEGSCTNHKTSVTVSYRLTCNSGGWQFAVGYGIVCCALPNATTGTYATRYSDGGLNGGAQDGSTSETCYPLSIPFNLATTEPGISNCGLGNTLPVLGGGGTIEVTA